jgi:uncharacterized repeat protein (TIGR03837 family)
MTIDILCKVVDNYGDIGVVYRLAKALSDIDPDLSLRIIVDKLAAFQALRPDVDPGKTVQTVKGWTIVQWDFPWEGFHAEPPRIVLECFACGRPDWFEHILFDPADGETKHIVNLEHLTAEDFAEDFHRMPSLTRSSLVKKHVFMPGFTAKTGGLIMDSLFREACSRSREGFADPFSRGRARRSLAETAGLSLRSGDEDRFWVLIFSYEHDFARIVADLAAFGREEPVLALVANGRSEACFMKACKDAGMPFPAIALPFLPQENWDEFLLTSDFSIIRGEESLSRAALSGRPFLWHAYVQDNAHQQVKVKALLERMRQHFESGDYALLESLSLAFNDRHSDDPSAGGDERLLPLLRAGASVEEGFRSFSVAIFAQGDLAAHLMTFIREFV